MVILYVYCVELQRGMKFNKDYLRNTVAKEIAPFWHDVGFQLGVKHLNSIQNIDNPTQYKFDKMLETWVCQQECSKDKVYDKIHKALKGIEMIRAAEKFHSNAHDDIN